MGKARNRNKNKTTDKGLDATEKGAVAAPEPKSDVLTGNSDEADPTGRGDDTDKTEPKSPLDEQVLNGQKTPTTPQEGHGDIVNKPLTVVEQTKKLWVVMGLVAGVFAVLGHISVGDQFEQLVVEKGVALSQNRARVFRFVGDLSNYNQWFPGIAKFDPIDAIPMGIGKHFTEVIEFPIYGEVRYDNVVTAYESPRLVSFVSDSWLGVRVEIELERRDSSKTPTSLKYRVYARCKTYLTRYFVLPALKMMYGNRVRQALFNMRFILRK